MSTKDFQGSFTGSPESLEVSDDGYLIIKGQDEHKAEFTNPNFKVAIKLSDIHLSETVEEILLADKVKFYGEWRQNLGYFFADNWKVIEGDNKIDETRNLERIKGIPQSLEVYDTEMAFNVKFKSSRYPAKNEPFEATFEYTEIDDLGKLLEDIMTADKLRLIGYWQNNIFHVRGYDKLDEFEEH